MDIDRDDGCVSIWLCSFDGSSELDQYLREQYENDDAPVSKFAEDAGISWYDHDFLEAALSQGKDGVLGTIWEGLSYSSSFAAEAMAAIRERGLEGENAVLLLYRYAYECDEEVKVPLPESDLKYLGTFRYDENAPAL